MRILVMASEVAPFARTGGLADVSGALPRALKERGHDVRVILPFYRQIEKGPFPLTKLRRSVEINLAGTFYKGQLRQTIHRQLPVYFLENRHFFGREQLYGPAGGDYEDNDQRFAFFCRAVLAMLKRIDFRPDIIHCNDWQTALVPLILASELASDPFFATMAPVLTIHNLAFQGIFEATSLRRMGLNSGLLNPEELEFFGRVNLLKGGIRHARMITTVSPTYRSEILTPEGGCGLEGVLRQRQNNLIGIINGIDPGEWDPAADPDIPRPFSATALAGKGFCKRQLQKELGLPISEETPLIGMVSRLTSQKGVDLLVSLLPRLAAADLQLVILGSGEEPSLGLSETLQRLSPTNIRLLSTFDLPLSRRIFAGSDIFLMPSRFEPCGIGQLIALRYGAIPVARRTGGLADTLIDSSERNGYAFLFDDYSADALWQTIGRAQELFHQPTPWRQLIRRGMRSDFSWQSSAEQYEQAFRNALAMRRP